MQAQFEEQQRAKEEEVLLVETQYQDLQSEVEDMRKLIKAFRHKYKQAVQEIKDLNQEHFRERQELFKACQTFEQDAQLYREILLKGIVSEADLKNLAEKCAWNDDKKMWVIPRFRLTSQGLGTQDQ